MLRTPGCAKRQAAREPANLIVKPRNSQRGTGQVSVASYLPDHTGATASDVEPGPDGPAASLVGLNTRPAVVARDARRQGLAAVGHAQPGVAGVPPGCADPGGVEPDATGVHCLYLVAKTGQQAAQRNVVLVGEPPTVLERQTRTLPEVPQRVAGELLVDQVGRVVDQVPAVEPGAQAVVQRLVQAARRGAGSARRVPWPTGATTAATALVTAAVSHHSRFIGCLPPLIVRPAQCGRPASAPPSGSSRSSRPAPGRQPATAVSGARPAARSRRRYRTHWGCPSRRRTRPPVPGRHRCPR